MNMMIKHEFKVGQTVYSPFGTVKIIHAWKKAKTYDVKFLTNKPHPMQGDIGVHTETWTFDEHELTAFSAGGVAFPEDDALQIINVERVDGKYIATFSVWIKVEIDGKICSLHKKFKKVLEEQ